MDIQLRITMRPAPRPAGAPAAGRRHAPLLLSDSSRLPSGCRMRPPAVTGEPGPSETADAARAQRQAEAARAQRQADSARAQRDAELAGLVAATANGDCSAFEAFYDRTIGYAQAVARRLLDGADVEDLLADAYFEAWRNAARFDPVRGSAVTWLLTIVRSRALDLVRRKSARPDGVSTDERPDAADEAADPIEALWQRREGSRLHVALTALSGNERWTLGLAYFRDCSHSEIARITGMPLGTVKSLILRAQSKLRQSLSAADQPTP